MGTVSSEVKSEKQVQHGIKINKHFRYSIFVFSEGWPSWKFAVDHVLCENISWHVHGLVGDE